MRAPIGVAGVGMLAFVGAVGLASAETHRASFHYKLKPGPQVVLTGNCAGVPFGNGTVNQKQLGEGVYTSVLKVRGGSVTLSLKGAPVGNTIKGTWRAVSGTGKFKGITGKGTVVTAAVAELIFSGSVTF